MTLLSNASSLGVVTDFIRSGAREANLPKSRIDELEVIVEEAFINVCRYAYPDGPPGDFTISYDVPGPGRLCVKIGDHGIEFNPLIAPGPSLHSERPAIGGLGIHLLKSFAESLDYCREHGVNRLTFEISADRP